MKISIKSYLSILAFWLLGFLGFAQGPTLGPNPNLGQDPMMNLVPMPLNYAPTGFLYKKEVTNQFYICGISDRYNCFGEMGWYRSYINLSRMKVDPSLTMTSNYSFLGKVIEEVKRTEKAQLILIDQEINVIKKGAFEEGILKVRPNGAIHIAKPNTPYLEVDRLSYVGLQLPSLSESQTSVVVKLDNVAAFCKYNLNGYNVRLVIKDAKQKYVYKVGFGQEVSIPLSVLLNSTVTCVIRHNGVVINKQCLIIPSDPYDPYTLDIPYGVQTCVETDDQDHDGIFDAFDNCIDIYNPNQQDTDGDGKGDVCDEDIDGDGIFNDVDNCVYNFNPDQTDSNTNGIGDFCEGDIDGDGILDGEDNCVYISNYFQEDMDFDGIGDMCDDDMDGDGVSNEDDNCLTAFNVDQSDVDDDGVGDLCDNDIDGDGIKNDDDNCRYVANAGQEDLDEDGQGDACDPNPEIDLDSQCQITPDESGLSTALQAFNVSWEGDANAGDADLVVTGDREDYELYSTAQHPGVTNTPFGVVDYDIYINPERTMVKHPIFIVDGFDPTTERTKDDIFNIFGGVDNLRRVWEEGYDLIICDFLGGADFIQKNGLALQWFLKQTKDKYGLDEIPAVIGPSMGGQIIRFALLDWEANKLDEWGPHNVRLFLSADSPWRGANASPAMQALSLQDENDLFVQIRFLSNAPAARQMLTNHVGGDGSSHTYTPQSHPFKTQIDSEYLSMGDVPSMVGKIIAIADGSASGTSTKNTPAGNDFVKISADAELPFGITKRVADFEISTIEKEEKLLDFSLCNACALVPPEMIAVFSNFHDVKATQSGRELDSAPGSPFELSKVVKDGQKIYALGLDIEIEFSDPEFRDFCFIPTFSALNLDTNDPFLNIMATDNMGEFGFTHFLSPFDDLFYDGVDRSHNGFKNIANGMNEKDFFFKHLETLVDVPKIEDIDCLVTESIQAEDILQQFNFAFDCDETMTTFSCLPGLFPWSVDWTITQTSGYPGIDFTEENDTFLADYTGLAVGDVSASFEVCAEFGGFFCKKTLCSEVTIDVTLTDDCVDLGGLRLEDPNAAQVETEAQTVRIVPNPAYDRIQLDNQFLGEVFIYSMDGKLVQRHPLNQLDATIPLQLPSGLYQVSILDENGGLVEVQKLVIVR